MNAKTDDRRRFVVLLHEMPADSIRETHYDLMLEMGEVLWTWEINKLPRLGTTITGRRLKDHRKKYLTYEGNVSDNRGCITRIMAGTFEVQTQDDSFVVVDLTVDFPVDSTEQKLTIRISTNEPDQKCHVCVDPK